MYLNVIIANEKCLFQKKKKNSVRGFIILPAFLESKEGPKNIAHSMSCLLCPVPQSREENEAEEYVKWVAQESTPVALTTRAIERASEHDPELKIV